MQLLLGHTKMDSTVRYLGVDIEDALSLSDGIDLQPSRRPAPSVPVGPTLTLNDAAASICNT